jgi:hypothetical protein
MAMLQASKTYQQDYGFLRRVLQANSFFSTLSGGLFILASGPVAAFLGLDASGIILGTGVLLLLFAADVFYVATRETLNRTFVVGIIAADLLWVAGSALLLLTDWVAWTNAGFWAVVIVADLVATFAALQWFGLRRGR